MHKTVKYTLMGIFLPVFFLAALIFPVSAAESAGSSPVALMAPIEPIGYPEGVSYEGNADVVVIPDERVPLANAPSNGELVLMLAGGNALFGAGMILIHKKRAA